MPPFLVVGNEAVRLHQVLQEHAVGALCGRDRGVGRPGPLAEEVEARAHVQLSDPAGTVPVDDRQVHRAAPRVAGAGSDIAQLEQVLLRDIGIILRLGPLVLQVPAPAHEVIDRVLGAVGIEDLEPQAEWPQCGLDPGQCFRCGCGQDRLGMPVAVDRLPDKVVRGGITQLDDQVGYGLVQVDKAVRQGRALRGSLSQRQRGGKKGTERVVHREVAVG